MGTMNISLPDPMKSWVEDQAKSGRYANSSDYVRDLIRATGCGMRRSRKSRRPSMSAWPADRLVRSIARPSRPECGLGMPQGSNWTIRPAAEADLADIWIHGAANWGTGQAERYADGLFALFELLAAYPEMAGSGRILRRRCAFIPADRIW